MKKDLKDLRTDYQCPPLQDEFMGENPLELFTDWFEQVLELDPETANACTLSTCGQNMRPRGRIVLIKEFSENGFLFFTDYESKKGQALDENPRAGLSFYWPQFFRQVHIEGNITKAPEVFNQEYFHSRPLESQCAAAISKQSRPVLNRETLEEEFQLCLEQNPKVAPFPKNWGGYWLKPTLIEFWQGRANRLHDRLNFVREADGSWQSRRLYP